MLRRPLALALALVLLPLAAGATPSPPASRGVVAHVADATARLVGKARLGAFLLFKGDALTPLAGRSQAGTQVYRTRGGVQIDDASHELALRAKATGQVAVTTFNGEEHTARPSERVGLVKARSREAIFGRR